MSNDPHLPPLKDHDPEQKTVLNVYGAFGASIVLTFIPSSFMAVLAFLMFAGVLTAAYMLRKRYGLETLTGNHMTFLIRTIWMSGALVMVGTAIGAFYMLPRVDYSPIEACAGNYDPDIFMAQCFEPFLSVNNNLFVTSTVLSGLPAIAYILYRFFVGLGRAVKGYRLADPKKLF